MILLILAVNQDYTAVDGLSGQKVFVCMVYDLLGQQHRQDQCCYPHEDPKPRVLTPLYSLHESRIMRKQAFCICEVKDPDQLRGSREADQHLCFRYLDSTIPLLPKSEILKL